MDERSMGESRKVTIIPKPNPDARLNVHAAHLARADAEQMAPIEARIALNREILEATAPVVEQITAMVNSLDRKGQGKKKNILSPQKTVSWQNADETAQIGWDSIATYRKKGDATALQSCDVTIHGSHPQIPDAIIRFQFEGTFIKTIQFIGSLNLSDDTHIGKRLSSLTDEQKELLSAIGSEGLVYQDVDGGIDRLSVTLPTRLDDVNAPIEVVFEEEQRNDPNIDYYRKDEPYTYKKYGARWVQNEKADVKQLAYTHPKKPTMPITVKKRKGNPKSFPRTQYFTHDPNMREHFIKREGLKVLIGAVAAFLPQQEVVV